MGDALTTVKGSDRDKDFADGQVLGSSCTGSERTTIVSTRFGTFDFNIERQIRFGGGLAGFPKLETYQLEHIPGIETDALLLQAIDDVEAAFFVIAINNDGNLIKKNDVAEVSGKLRIDDDDLLILLMLNLTQQDGKIIKSVNLRAPLFIDVKHRNGTQVVMGSDEYPMRMMLEPTDLS